MSENRHERRSYARERRAAVAARAPSSPLLFVFLAFLALFQASVVQTHIHVVGAAARLAAAANVLPSDRNAVAAVAASQTSSAQPRDSYPADEDPSNCPLCQEVAHLGQFVHSANLVMAPLFSVAVSFTIADECQPAISAVAHFWHGRAPPSL